MLKLGHRHIGLDVETSMSGSFLGSNRQVDLFIDDLTFLVVNGWSLQHLLEVVALENIASILPEWCILVRLVWGRELSISCGVLRLLHRVRYVDPNSILWLEKHFDRALRIKVEIDSKGIVTLSSSLRKSKYTRHVVEQGGNAVCIRAEIAIQCQEVVHVRVKGVPCVFLWVWIRCDMLGEHVICRHHELICVDVSQLLFNHRSLFRSRCFRCHSCLQLFESRFPSSLLFGSL